MFFGSGEIADRSGELNTLVLFQDFVYGKTDLKRPLEERDAIRAVISGLLSCLKYRRKDFFQEGPSLPALGPQGKQCRFGFVPAEHFN